MKVEIHPSLTDGEYDVDLIKGGSFNKSTVICTGMHTKASAIGYAIHYLCRERLDYPNSRVPFFDYEDLSAAQIILEDIERQLSRNDEV